MHAIGLDFFIREIPDEVFTYSDDDPMQFVEVRPDVYPYLVGLQPRPCAVRPAKRLP